MRTKIEVAVAVFLLGLLGLGRLELWQTNKELHEATTQRDSVAAEFAAERARAEGLTVDFAQERQGLQAALEAKDSTLQKVLSDYRASRVRVASYTKMLATAEGRIKSLGNRVDSLKGSGPRRWSGTLADRVLSGSWTFWEASETLDLDYSVRLGAEIIHSVTGDGRLLVTARPLADNVTLRVPELLVDPPPPLIRVKRDWKLTVLTSAASLVMGAFAWELAR